MRIINISFLLLTLITNLIISAFYSCLIDIFPWGDSKAYVIWAPLIVYFIIPGFLVASVFRFVLLKEDSGGFWKLSFLIVAILFYVPILVGFDSEADQLGRWLGVLLLLVSVSFLGIELILRLSPREK